MAIHGNTQIGPTKMDIIAAAVQKELKFAAKLSPLFTDFSAFAVKGAKSVSIPKLGSLTVENRASGVEGTPQVAAATADKLDLDIRAYISFIVDPQDAVQSVLDWEMVLAERAGSAHGRYVDSQLVAALTTYKGYDLGLAAITRDGVIDARKQLLKNDFAQEELSLVISVAQESEMLKIAEFTQAQIYGTSNVPAGLIGRVYGVPVYVSNALADAEAFMCAKSALGYAFQRAPVAAEQAYNQAGVGAKLIATEQLFGIKGLQLDEKGVAAGKSPGIVSIL